MRVNIEEIPDWKGGLDYCRRVVDNLAQDESLEVFRYQTPAYVIKSIQWAAAHRITEDRGLRIKKW